jgi:hypothetical protein
MKVTKERIEELRRLYKDAYGEELSYPDAEAMGHRLVTLYKLLTQPLPNEVKSPSREPPAQTAP